MTTADAARSLKITEKSVGELCREKKLPGAKLVLMEWVRKRKTYKRWSWSIPASSVAARRRAMNLMRAA